MYVCLIIQRTIIRTYTTIYSKALVCSSSQDSIALVCSSSKLYRAKKNDFDPQCVPIQVPWCAAAPKIKTVAVMP